MTLNGRKKKLKREDFINAAKNIRIEQVVVKRLINKHIKLLPTYEKTIQNSFLSIKLKEKYCNLLRERISKLSSK